MKTEGGVVMERTTAYAVLQRIFFRVVRGGQRRHDFFVRQWGHEDVGFVLMKWTAATAQPYAQFCGGPWPAPMPSPGTAHDHQWLLGRVTTCDEAIGGFPRLCRSDGARPTQRWLNAYVQARLEAL